MRKTLERAIAAFMLTAVTCFGFNASAGEKLRATGSPMDAQSASMIVIPADAKFPMTKQISVGAGKSVMLQFPTPLKDVLVADPGRMDAVVQSANQVFLIAKTPGATNAFFFDQNGQQILTLEVSIGADMDGLQSLLKRLIPASNITLEMAGRSVVLTGTVRTAIDSNRATDIAREFVKATKGAIAAAANPGTAAPGQAATGSTVSLNVTGAAGRGGSGVEEATEKLVINLLSVEGEEQVMLRVHVAEVSRTLLKQFGINIGAQVNAGNFSSSVLSENALPLTSAIGLGKLAVPGIGTGAAAAAAAGCATAGVLCNYNSGPNGTTYGGSGVTSGFNLGGGNKITQALQAFERDGLIRTLAEPNLTAVSGESAKFLAGGEYPVPTVDSTGQISIVYKEYGVGVAFTPIVMSEGRISLKIETEVSELTTDGAVVLNSISIPALTKRQAKSTVELPSGGSIAIAGLISDKVKQNLDGYPGLKDLPVLGTLFRSRDFVKEESELVIIVTPYLVHPTARQNLALPQDGLAEASDLRTNFMGQLNKVYGRNPRQPVGDLKGDYGFIVE